MSMRAELEKMPLEQMTTLLRLTLRYPESTWHWNDCGCCICLHPEGKTHNKTGYIIGADGESEFRDARADP